MIFSFVWMVIRVIRVVFVELWKVITVTPVPSPPECKIYIKNSEFVLTNQFFISLIVVYVLILFLVLALASKMKGVRLRFARELLEAGSEEREEMLLCAVNRLGGRRRLTWRDSKGDIIDDTEEQRNAFWEAVYIKAGYKYTSKIPISADLSHRLIRHSGAMRGLVNC